MTPFSKLHIHRFSIGLRTLKTMAAVLVSMLVVESYGASSSKLLFAMLGAMAAVQPTFKESAIACLTQIIGVLIGALIGIFLLKLPLPPLIATGLGLVLVITIYNAMGIGFSPSLACFMVVFICTTPDIKPLSYATGRIWDTTIGLFIGLSINTLVYPYDNSRKIRLTVESLSQELLDFLVDLFDEDEHIPNTNRFSKVIDNLASQLKIFEDQLLLLRLKRHHKQLKAFHLCQSKARELVAQMEVLSHMGKPGVLSPENYEKLVQCGAEISVPASQKPMDERDIITNYHISQIIQLRQDLLDALNF